VVSMGSGSTSTVSEFANKTYIIVEGRSYI
jgi:hypothetical protein